jgi:hypothetical protein
MKRPKVCVTINEVDKEFLNLPEEDIINYGYIVVIKDGIRNYFRVYELFADKCYCALIIKGKEKLKELLGKEGINELKEFIFNHFGWDKDGSHLIQRYDFKNFITDGIYIYDRHRFIYSNKNIKELESKA